MNKFAGCAGGAQFVAAHDSAVGNTKLHKQFLFCIVRDKCNIHIIPLSSVASIPKAVFIQQ